MESLAAKTNRGEEPVRIESSSRPGLFHHVDVERNFCSCPATVEVCRHLRIARIRAAKTNPQRRYIADRGGLDETLERKRAEVKERGSYRPDTSQNANIAAALNRMSHE